MIQTSGFGRYVVSAFLRRALVVVVILLIAPVVVIGAFDIARAKSTPDPVCAPEFSNPVLGRCTEPRDPTFPYPWAVPATK